MKNLNFFQVAVLLGFAAVGLIGVFIFAFFSRGGDGGFGINQTKLTMWGSEQVEKVNIFLKTMEDYGLAEIKIDYTEIPNNTFESELLEALASGVGPDLILVPHDRLYGLWNKLYEIPYESYTQRDFKDSFVQAGEIFLTSTGVLGFPLELDPLVMYWNRDIFNTAGIANPPKNWPEFYTLARSLTKLDSARNVVQSAIAAGEISNITHSKEVLSTLMIQAGNKVVALSPDGQWRPTITNGQGVIEALRYYTEFSNPVKPVYSWNRALPTSKDYFLSAKLATYFGFASEYADLRRKNPNLNFDVATLPQAQDQVTRATFGRITAISVLRSSRQAASAFEAATILTSSPGISLWSGIKELPPVRRDLLQNRPSDAADAVFYDSSLIATNWLDPDRQQTVHIFQEMVESLVSGRASISAVIARASELMTRLFE
jgi:multiple sugar transport system substrate-binding protein